MLRHTGFGLQGCLLFCTQRCGAIGHPGLGVRQTGQDTAAAQTRRQARHGGCFLGTWSLRRIRSWGLASVVLLVGGAGPVIVLAILAACAGVALAAGACALRCCRRRLRRRRAPAFKPVTIPRTNPVEVVHARHVKVHERIVGQIFLLYQAV
jgi:hypothetical protein